jgi:hypothetical protein
MIFSYLDVHPTDSVQVLAQSLLYIPFTQTDCLKRAWSWENIKLIQDCNYLRLEESITHLQREREGSVHIIYFGYI